MKNVLVQSTGRARFRRFMVRSEERAFINIKEANISSFFGQQIAILIFSFLVFLLKQGLNK